MNILLCGEGKHDIGEPDYWCDSQRDYVSLDGWLQPIVRAIRGNDIKLAVRKRRDLTLLPKDEKKYRPLPDGHGRKALIAKIAADAAGFDVVIYMVDADSVNIERWREIHAEITDGFSRVSGPAVGIACIPMSASESWLLADADAWAAIAGDSALPLPANPESVWGEKADRDGDRPHNIFARVCEKAEVQDSHAVRHDLAKIINVGVLRAKCPQSFIPFHDDLAAA